MPVFRTYHAERDPRVERKAVPQAAPTTQHLRWGGLAGILVVAVLLVASVLLRHSPSTSQPTRDITLWFTDHRSTALVAAYLLGFAAAVLLFFAGALRTLLRRGDDLDALASVAFAGGVAAAVTELTASGMVAILAFRPDTTPDVARALYDANGLLFAFNGFPVAVLISATSIVALGSGVLPRWLGWAGLVVAVLQLVGAASFARAGAFMPQGDNTAVVAAAGSLLLWLLATSILMLRPSTAAPYTEPGRG